MTTCNFGVVALTYGLAYSAKGNLGQRTHFALTSIGPDDAHTMTTISFVRNRGFKRNALVSGAECANPEEISTNAHLRGYPIETYICRLGIPNSDFYGARDNLFERRKNLPTCATQWRLQPKVMRTTRRCLNGSERG